MNTQGRKQITSLISTLQQIKTRMDTLKDDLGDIGGEIEDLSVEENDKYENLPPALQYGERGETMQQIADALSEAADVCNNADWADIDSVIARLEEARDA